MAEEIEVTDDDMPALAADARRSFTRRPNRRRRRRFIRQLRSIVRRRFTESADQSYQYFIRRSAAGTTVLRTRPLADDDFDGLPW